MKKVNMNTEIGNNFPLESYMSIHNNNCNSHKEFDKAYQVEICYHPIFIK